MISSLLQIIAAVGYLVASVFYGALLFKQHVNNRPAWLTLARIGGVLGLLAHTASIGVHCVTTHHSPMQSLPEALSAVGWAIAGVYVITELLMWKNPPTSLGALAFPAAFLTLFAGVSLTSVSGPATSASVQLDNELVSLHLLAIIGSYGMLTLAACCGALYLIEHRLLKRKKVASGLFSRLPPLATIDHMAFTLASLAMTLLTLGLVAGEIRAYTTHQPIVDAMVLVSALSWLIFGTYLLLHSSRILTGVRANYLLFAGLFVALLAFFVKSPMHHFG